MGLAIVGEHHDSLGILTKCALLKAGVELNLSSIAAVLKVSLGWAVSLVTIPADNAQMNDCSQ